MTTMPGKILSVLGPEAPPAPAGRRERFGGRWRFVGAGLSNIWRFGDLELPAVSGRLLLRGPNGTGKTTALEALWPFLLDMNGGRLAAGKARATTLSALMREGATSKRRVGYLWMSFAAPEESEWGQEVVSYGARVTFSEGATPQVSVAPFFVPGVPLQDLALWGVGRVPLGMEDFKLAVGEAGGMVFDKGEDYVRDLASRMFGSTPGELLQLATRIRAVRNPAVLGAVSPREAAAALRESLPSVDAGVVEATGEALAASDATRQAFEHDKAAADVLEDFVRVWRGHCVEVVGQVTEDAQQAADAVNQRTKVRDDLTRRHQGAVARAREAEAARSRLGDEHTTLAGTLKAIEQSEGYKNAGRLQDLAVTLEARENEAEAEWRTLVAAVESSARWVAAARTGAQDLAEDFARLAGEVAQVAPEAPGAPILSWREDARGVLRAGSREIDGGDVLRVEVEAGALDLVQSTWERLGTEEARVAGVAATLVAAHQSVDQARQEADKATQEAARLARSAEELGGRARVRSEGAGAAALALRGKIEAWHRELGRGPHVGRVSEELAETVPFGAEDIADLGWSEAAGALAGVDDIAEMVATWAHENTSAATTRARELGREVERLHSEATGKRTEAARYRDHEVLLAFPRPDWAGPGDDEAAFGAAVSWVDGVDERTREIVEATLAAAGVLGAELEESGAVTSAWSVAARGTDVAGNLSELLAAEPGHPLGDVAEGVLRQIALVQSVEKDELTGGELAGGGLVAIGRDGSFRAGMLRGLVDVTRDEVRPRAQYIGARQRREAALRHAEALEGQADALEGQAADLEDEAARQRDQAAAFRSALKRFPSTSALRHAEAARSAAVEAAREAEEAVAAAEDVAEGLSLKAAEEQRQWVAGVRAAGLAGDVEALQAKTQSSRAAAGRLERSAELLGVLGRRMEALAEESSRQCEATDFDEACGRSQRAASRAKEIAAKHAELVAAAGASVESVLERHREVTTRLEALALELEGALGAERAAGETAAGLAGKLDAAEDQVNASLPEADEALRKLRQLLEVPGVAEAVLDDGVSLVGAEGEGAGAGELEGGGAALLEQVRGAISSQARSARGTLRQRADEAKAAVAGVWSLDPGVDHPVLDTFMLTHRDVSYTPVAGARHARSLAEEAGKALAAADEKALEDFVVGQLPAAVAQAWVSLHDWVKEVNRKMKTAAASSGVGVAVRLSVCSDLAPAARTVYELCCRSGEALLEREAKEKVGTALGQLIGASEGEDMTERVRNAVDVRAWVDVNYEVTRPDQEPRTWTSRTGLSGGERRLVVLAPMLGAVAAAYDKFGESAPRLAALDEVPAEVDELGREGIARYIAELDLDLIATSYLWDGAPGAWDGVDAHDLEAGPDGTVVAFPMLIRGLEPLPGDVIGTGGPGPGSDEL